MPIDFDVLRGTGAPATPDDGDHVAWLERAAIVETQNGERLVTEWRDTADKSVQWTSWNRFDTTGMSYTRDLLLGLGVDLSTVNDTVDLSDGLIAKVGLTWRVTTKSQMGSQGDRVFVTTYVNGRDTPVEPDVPIDTRGLAEPAAAPAPAVDDAPPF